MSSSSSEIDLIQELHKVKKKLKKLSRRKHRRSHSKDDHRSRHRSRSRQSRHQTRNISSTRSIERAPSVSLHNIPNENEIFIEKENVDPEAAEIINEEHTIPEALLVALGDDKPTEEKYGPDINPLIASRWEKVLLNNTDEIKEIIKSHKIPSNCVLLQAPELNLEVKAAITESARNRDQTLQQKQQQLGIALSCLGQAMTNILAGQEITDVLKLLSDGTKILTSLHHQDTSTRKQLLAPLLDKKFIKMTESIPRNQFLFGDNLGEKIKNTKEIEKSGEQLRKPKPSFNRPGNWKHQNNQKPTPRGGHKLTQQAQRKTKKSYQPTKKPMKHANTKRPERSYQRARHHR